VGLFDVDRLAQVLPCGFGHCYRSPPSSVMTVPVV